MNLNNTLNNNGTRERLKAPESNLDYIENLLALINNTQIVDLYVNEYFFFIEALCLVIRYLL